MTASIRAPVSSRHASLHVLPPAVRTPADVPVTHSKPLATPVTCTRAVYSALDELTGADKDELLQPILTDVHARATLSKNIPIRTHSIWTSLLGWNKESVHLISSTKPEIGRAHV